MALHPGERRGAKGTDLGGQFVGPKSIARFLVKLLKPDHEHKSGEPEPDMRRTMGRLTTAGGSVISARLPSRKPQIDDRVVDTRDPRRLGTVASLQPEAEVLVTPGTGGRRGVYKKTPATMRVHWDDGTHEVRPQESVTPPLREPARSFDAHPLHTSPAVRKMTPAPARSPEDQFRRHLSDEVAAGRVDPGQAADALRAAGSADMRDPTRAKFIADRPAADARAEDARKLATEQRAADAKGMSLEEWRASRAPKKATKASPAAAKMARGKAAAPKGLPRGFSETSRTDLEDALGSKTPAELKALAEQVNIDMPGHVRSQSARAKLLVQAAEVADRRNGGRTGDALIAAARDTGSPTPSFDAADVRSRLASAQSREEGEAVLKGLTVAQLREVSPLAASAGKGKPDAVRKVLNAEAPHLYGAGLATGTPSLTLDGPAGAGKTLDLPSSALSHGLAGSPWEAGHADGLDAMPDHSLASYAQEWDIPDARSKTPAELRAALRAQGVGSPQVEQAKRAGEEAAAKADPHIEIDARQHGRDATEILRGRRLTPEGRAALDALGPAGHPRIAAIPTTEGKIRGAYAMLADPRNAESNDKHVNLEDLRKLIGDQVPRSEVDDALLRMHVDSPDVNIVPQSYARHVGTNERLAAAVTIGGQERNLIHIDGIQRMPPPPPASAVTPPRAAGSPAVAKMARAAKAAPAKKAAPKEPFDATDLADSVYRMRTREEKAAALEQVTTVANLRKFATAHNVQLPKRGDRAFTAPELRQYILDQIERDKTRWSLR